MNRIRNEEKKLLRPDMCQQNRQPRKIGQVVEIYSLPRLSQEETDKLSKLITRTEIASIIIKTKAENSQLTELQDWMASLGNSIKHAKKSLYLSFSKYSKSHSRKSPSPWYQTRQRHHKKKKKERNYRPLSLNIEAKILSNILAKQIQQDIRGIIHHNQVGFTPRSHTQWNIASSSHIDGPRDYHTKWNQRQITITHIWNLKK